LLFDMIISSLNFCFEFARERQAARGNSPSLSGFLDRHTTKIITPFLECVLKV